MRVDTLYNVGFDFGFENPDTPDPPDGSCCPGSYLEGLRNGRTERLACEELCETGRKAGMYDEVQAKINLVEFCKKLLFGPDCKKE